MRLIFLLAALGIAVQAGAQARQCTKHDAIAAEDAAGKPAPTWAALHDVYTRFGHCDDGAIGEGFSNSTVRLLALHWDQMGALQNLAQRDRRFRQFVLRHIDSTADAKHLDRLVANAANQCPAGAKALCAAIRKAGETAKKEQKS